MMDTEQLLTWAESRHFPQLVLSSHEVVRAGELNWQRFTRYASPEQLGQAIERVERWTVYEQREGIPA